jgi:hypothetical protein
LPPQDHQRSRLFSFLPVPDGRESEADVVLKADGDEEITPEQAQLWPEAALAVEEKYGPPLAGPAKANKITNGLGEPGPLPKPRRVLKPPKPRGAA